MAFYRVKIFIFIDSPLSTPRPANVCMACYDLNGPNNVNVLLDVEAKRRLIADRIKDTYICFLIMLCVENPFPSLRTGRHTSHMALNAD